MVKCLLLKPEFRFPANTQKTNTVVCICTPSAENGGRVPGALWPANLAKAVSSKFNKRFHLKKYGREP